MCVCARVIQQTQSCELFQKLKMNPTALYSKFSFVSFFINDVCHKAARKSFPTIDP